MRLLFALSLLVPSLAFAEKPLEICSDSTDWAPYMYNPRVDGVADKTQLTGFTYDLLEEIGRLSNIEYNISREPWKRCLQNLDNFAKKPTFEAVVDGSYSLERAEKYYISESLYTTVEGVWYSAKKYPDGIPFYKTADVNNFNICSVLGYNMEPYYKDLQLSRDKKINTSSRTVQSTLKMVSRGRCDIFPNSVEPIYGGVAIEQLTLPEDIRSIPFPGAKPATFHLYITKDSPRAHQLIADINHAIQITKHNGVYEKLHGKYFPPSED